ncbi:hypothetical protein ACFYNM_39915 [Streptomyces spororaveus]|uniref:hypothetical protein n=1 Tax=Streptomyces spororaveus TaxID=284039 RepID=UPI00368AED82
MDLDVGRLIGVPADCCNRLHVPQSRGALLGGFLRYEFRAAVGAAVLLFMVSTGCTRAVEAGGAPPLSGSSPATPAAAPSPEDLTHVLDRARAMLVTAEAGGADAPGEQGFMLVRAWQSGAAFAWETKDQRLCGATVSGPVIQERGCAVNPLDPPIKTPGGVSAVDTVFGDGWGRVFAADHVEVTSATCSGEPVEVRRVGSVVQGSRTLYAVWFPDYTKGTIDVSLLHNGTVSETRFWLGDAGDRTCGEES